MCKVVQIRGKGEVSISTKTNSIAGNGHLLKWAFQELRDLTSLVQHSVPGNNVHTKQKPQMCLQSE